MNRFNADPIYPRKAPMAAPPPYSSSSTSSSPPSGSPITFAAFSLHGLDKLRFLQIPEAEVPALRAVIQSSWHRGIQREQLYGGSLEFKLHGNPWGHRSTDAIPSRVIIACLIQHLYHAGWRLVVATDCTKLLFDKDALLFRRNNARNVLPGFEDSPGGFVEPREEVDVLVVSFNEADRLRLIGAEESLVQSIRALLKSMWKLQSESWRDRARNAWEFKLNGRPWLATGFEAMTTRKLLLKCLETLERHGWCLYASVDQNAHREGVDLDVWYCIRRKNWVPGMEVLTR
ncbi:hypothetical protein BP6252_01676 [Coleophoma cylindrospora]|uniref:Uncharacterized protein n=1 Tax=Coleophoma cylindrospora TaxID=1849047 RepID=A0A3D8STQ9_9HELO|nr:hypothetical protein BP6252_01676 [Coleophoma cylindrospora]